MSNVGYDLDTSGGLMPLIRALIKPPDEEANGQKSKKQQHPYYKRPGKGHNRDSCDACGEGGDLICCDRCPASFHLGCYDPPLDENAIPAGLWLCRQCRASDDTCSSTRDSRAHSPADSKGEDKKRILRTKKSKEDAKEESDTDSKKSNDSKEKEIKELTPMEVLVRAARVLNPTQFELPREMRVPCPFPGTEKEGSCGAPSVVTVDSMGLVPLPAKACFVCSGTCKAAPLLQCDYCPLLFHQDCLDPPLTALPTGRWMCPNHVEQYIDWKLVNSVSATERVALWDRFAAPVDQHAVKVDFIRRARTKHPCFRIKVPVGVRGRVVVPPAVRAMYDRPAALLPSRREVVRCHTVVKRLQSQDLYSEEPEDSKQSICLNMECPSYRGKGLCPRASGAGDDAEEDLKAIMEEKPDRPSDSSDLSDSDMEYLTAAVKRRKVCDDIPPRKDKILLRGISGAEESAAARLLHAVEQQLAQLDGRLVRLLAWQRLQQVLAGEQWWGSDRRLPLSPLAGRLVSASLDRSALALRGLKHVALPSELLTRTERDRIAKSVWGGIEQPQPPPPTSPGHWLCDASLIATVTPILRGTLGDSLGRPIGMRLSRLTVGTDSGCDVVLDAARCKRVSRRHAIVFMDEVTRHFELINYSEWGSMVNGVVYGCDLSERESQTEEDRLPFVAAKPATIRWGSEADLCGCPCLPAGPAWEGSALVPHGALLQFGCQSFVFSIVDTLGLDTVEPAI